MSSIAIQESSLPSMASNSCRQKEGERPCFASEIPHFFKIVLAPSLKEGKLEVPKKFVRKHGEALLNNQVCLKVPGGAEWSVGLNKINGRIWFQTGWPEFVEFYSVRFGYFLVFRYEGNSCFHVIIFDRSALEIRYPVRNTHHDEDNKVFDEQSHNEEFVEDKKVFDEQRQFHEEFEEDKEVFDGQRQFHKPKSSIEDEEFEEVKEVFDGQRQSHKPKISKEDKEFVDNGSLHVLNNIKGKRARKEVQAAQFLPDKKMKSNGTISRKNSDSSRKKVESFSPEQFNEKELKTDKMMGGINWYCSKIEFKGGDCSSDLEDIKCEDGGRKQPILTASQRARVIGKASTFISMTVNPSFMVTMRPSYICPGKSLGIPRSFSKVHLPESREIIVKDSDGRVWNIRCKVRGSLSYMVAEFKSGWKRFVRDNNLQEGDICVFEKLESSKMSLNVTIFRAFETAIN